MAKNELLNEFFTGINYWGSKHATNMWNVDKYDPQSIEEDMIALKKAGVTHLRIFPMWADFQPLTALYTTSDVPYEYTFGEEHLPDTEAGRAGVSEEACKNFENFCDIVEKYDLKLVVGLITGHMSFREFAPPAFAGKHRLSDPTVLKWQLRFVRYFVRRFKNRACIAGWDLGNEVNNMAHGKEFTTDDFYVWCSAIADAIRANDPDHPVISGMDASSPEKKADNLVTIRETCDMHTCHPYNIFQSKMDPLPSMKPTLDLAFRCRMYEDIAQVPTFVQEFGAIGYLNCSLKTEADFYRASLYTSLAHGCHGVMWWCAFDQGMHRFTPYDWNNIGSDYGFYDKDMKMKPLAEENLRFKEMLKKLPGGNLPKHVTDGVILVPRDNGDADFDKLRAAYLLAKQANLDMNFSYALDKIPDAPLYVLPSLTSNQPLPARRLDEILEKVENGAVLYLSLGASLFRRIPEITGVTVAWREIVQKNTVVSVAGEELPVTTPVCYQVESVDAEILGTDSEGTPVFFKKAWGKGQIYFSLIPFELNAALRPHVFHGDKDIDYSVIYREIAKSLESKKVADSDSPFIRLTEHPVDEKSRYIVAVNYNYKPEKAKITVKGGKLTPVHGAEIQDGVLSMRENDGAIFLYQAD
ncbi:MAG: hypothetical protein E7336_11800 [Clostridiales bacterium]|nr:hypothetical protein [Clostridiales bacterium]